MDPKADYEPFEVVEEDVRTILRLRGTAEQRAKVEADKVHIIMDAIVQGWDIDIKHADIEGDLDINTIPGKLEITEGDKLVIRGNIRMRGCNINGDADFMHTHFSSDADFSSTHFNGDVDFSFAQFDRNADFESAQFSGYVNFSFAQFNRNAHFVSAQLNRDVNFSFAHFNRDVHFSSAHFNGNVYLSIAHFNGNAHFVSAQFNRDVYIGSAHFSGYATFGGSMFRGLAFFSASTFTEEVGFDRTTFEGKADFSRARFLRDLYLNLAIFGESGSLSLENSVYPNIYISLPDDLSKASEFLNSPSEDTYLRLLKNQRDLSRPYKSLYVAMQRDRRAQKFPLVRWLEWFLFDFPTKYGTASFPPKGMLIYIASVLLIFTVSYYVIDAHLRRSRGVEILEYDKTDGGKVQSQRKLGTMDIFWFSLNTFIPAVKFVNVQHWRIRDDVVLKIIRCSTLATFESILGWLLIPILLRYFRL